MSSLFRFPIRVRVALEALSAKYVTPRMVFTPGLELCPAAVPMQSPEEGRSHSLSDLVNGIWLMAAPKSKVRCDFIMRIHCISCFYERIKNKTHASRVFFIRLPT